MKLRSVQAIPPPDPQSYQVKQSKKRVCTFDTETDPFKQSRIPEIVCCGFYDGENHFDWWGPDCVDQCMDHIAECYPPGSLLIYVHNLPFDYRYLRHHADHGSQPLIVNGRIIQCRIGGHEFRDSFKILPVALSKIQKDDFDYAKLERSVREQHKDEILRYQYGDCYYLYNAIVAFREQFGDALTVGNVAIRMLSSFTGFQRLSERADAVVREYFYGGRVECFETGVVTDDWKVYDVNSMYPDAMARYRHPIGNIIHRGKDVSDSTAFVHCTGWSQGAFPVRSGGDLTFPHGYGEFKVTVHEFNTALELGLFKVRRIIRTLDFEYWADFSPFIHHFYNMRKVAQAAGDKLLDLFYKLLLTNAYGKFSQNPNNFKQAKLLPVGTMPKEGIYSEKTPQGWSLSILADYGWIWERTARRRKNDYYNVATGASITGAARSTLFRGIACADRPVYCDTDSIICRGLPPSFVGSDTGALGAWKTEATGTMAGIAGKKTYVLYDGDRVVKQASKGVRLEPWEILEVASGGVIVHISDRPTFNIDGSTEFVERVIRRTG